MSVFEGFEGMESLEVTECTEQLELSNLKERSDRFLELADAAHEVGNLSESDFFQWKAAKLNEQMAKLEMDSGEITLGEGHADGHSETYWEEAAAKEIAEHGKTTWYYTCKERLKEAIKNDAK